MPPERSTPVLSNLVIRGDAATALGELGATHAGRVRLAYLDPPFNTGKHFAGYADRLAPAAWSKLLEACVAGIRPLLTDDASVWLHLDNAHAHLGRVVLDDVFGSAGYVGTVVWQKKRKPSFLHDHLASVTDQLLVYAPDRSKLAPFTRSSTAPDKPIPLHHTGSRLATLSFPARSVDFDCADGLVPAGDHSSARVRTTLLDDVKISAGTNIEAFRMEGEWRYTQEALAAHLRSGDRIRIAAVPFRPNRIRRHPVPKKITNLWSYGSTLFPTNESGTAELGRAGLAATFATPKPVGLLTRIIEVASEPGDLVLDCFAGSGTTAVAASALGRRWVLIEQESVTVDDCIVPRLRGSATRNPARSAPAPALPRGIPRRDVTLAARVLRAAREHGTFDDLDPDVLDAVTARLTSREGSTATEAGEPTPPSFEVADVDDPDFSGALMRSLLAR